MAITEATPTAAAAPLHPYYPLEAEIVGYLANEYSVVKLLVCFGSAVAVIFALTLMVVGRVAPRLSWGDRGTVLWFVLCEYWNGGSELWALG